MNRNKRSVALDLESDGGRQAVRYLPAPADVSVRLGLDEPSARDLRRSAQSSENSCVCGFRRSSLMAPLRARSLTLYTFSPRVMSDS